MATEVNIKAGKREKTGSSEARRLRRQGKIPAVVYGHGKAATPLTVDAHDMSMHVHHTGLLELNIDGRKKPVNAVINDVQYDVLRDAVRHVDFQEVRASERVTAFIPVHSHGEAAGEQVGGNLNQHIYELEIECPANQLPESIDVDVSELQLDNSISVKDLPLPSEATPQVDPEDVVFTVELSDYSEEEEEETGVEEEEGAEPEVIGEKEGEDEEENESEQ